MNGANPNIADEMQRTPLHEAAIGGYLGIVIMLLGHGAGIDARNDELNTAIFYVAINHNESVANLLLQRGTDKNFVNFDAENLLHFSVRRSDGIGQRFVPKLIRNGIDIDSSNLGGAPIIHAAVREFSRHRNASMIELLLERGLH